MDLRVFVSSTSIDLGEERRSILRLLSVIPADLIRMESFGSDESRPSYYSIANLRRCNLFVGIYAERYGTIDPATGCSITELEYREALRMLAAGELIGLLVYILDPHAQWKVEYVDRDPTATHALANLKAELTRSHSVTYFKQSEALALAVLRDVLRKIGVGSSAVLRPREPSSQRTQRSPRLLGMEHYTEADARFFRGREDAIAAISAVIDANPLTLLIGDSGIGKTSVIHAGLFPALRNMGWVAASCRPLDNPQESIPSILWAQLMQGEPPHASIGTVMNLISTAHADRRVLLAIDQLEDMLPYIETRSVSELISALRQVHNSPPGNLHILLSYRGDAEPKVGKYWQVISGSASGLPRYYLGPLTALGASNALTELFVAEGSPAPSPDSGALVGRIVADVEAESVKSLGISIYPPFLQMVAEILVKRARLDHTPIDAALYTSLGGASEIVARYLRDQLRLLGRTTEHRLVLISLANRKRRLRKSSDEIARERNLPLPTVDGCLSDLADLRLVRPIESAWEIVHDYLAQKVVEDLVAPEEREARLFRDVLSAKAAAFDATGELLTFREHLGIYSHRTRITYTQNEVQLLFWSGLAGNGPYGYFLKFVDDNLPIRWAEEKLSSEDNTTAQNACRYLVSRGRPPSLSILALIFSDYKLQVDLAEYVRRFSTSTDVPLMLKLRVKIAERVRDAAEQSLEAVLSSTPDPALLQKLLASRRSRDIYLACRVFLGRADPSLLGEYRNGILARSLLTRARSICGLGALGNDREITMILHRMRARRTGRVERELCAYVLATWSQAHKRPDLLRDLLTGPLERCRGALSALRGDRGGLLIEELLTQYIRLPHETAAAVRRTARPSDLPGLRLFCERVRMDVPMRDIVAAIVDAGGVAGTRFALDLIASKEEPVSFWNVPLLADRMVKSVDATIRPWLLLLTQSPEFWQYMKTRSTPSLPVQSPDNLYLFKRLAGISIAGACGADDWHLLKRLAFHPYWHVRVAATESIARFASSTHLDELVDEARRVAPDAADPGIAYALGRLDAKIYAVSS